ncbi:phage tail protein [uncultured Cohaesibacter sp.]|uniref:phage tail protein n=1 Tax=uncultured Cohaesibacter sp. TaxID=1002546 RepID=UPI0029C6C6D0|nr:phage tail protein [uncultured Cohaesibacter sp.]
MLYCIGAVIVDTRPFSAEEMGHSVSATWAEKAVMGTMPPSEFMGAEAETMTLSGTLLPYKLGGLTALETLKGYVGAGAVVPVMRGDGARLGNFALVSISETHKHLQRQGVGFVVSYSLSLKMMPGSGLGRMQTIEGLLSLFDAF